MTKKLHIKTWGCQMNVYDSDRMADVVAPLGYVPSENAEDADLVIFNTCHIREKATDKLFSELGKLPVLQKEKKAKGRTHDRRRRWMRSASRRRRNSAPRALCRYGVWAADLSPIAGNDRAG